MSSRRAARKIVSPGRMSTSRPSMLKVLGLSPALVVIFVAQYVAALSSPTPERLLKLFGKILEHAQQRIGRRLAKPADRGIAHRVREFRQQRLIPRAGCHQLDRLLGSGAARRALPAAFVLEEAHQVE